MEPAAGPRRRLSWVSAWPRSQGGVTRFKVHELVSRVLVGPMAVHHELWRRWWCPQGASLGWLGPSRDPASASLALECTMLCLSLWAVLWPSTTSFGGGDQWCPQGASLGSLTIVSVCALGQATLFRSRAVSGSRTLTNAYGATEVSIKMAIPGIHGPWEYR